MILGGLAANSSFSRADIEALDAAAARYWWNALAAYHKRVREETS